MMKARALWNISENQASHNIYQQAGQGGGGYYQDPNLAQNNMSPTYDRENVWASRRTIRAGERVAVWDNTTGELNFIDGPQRPFFYRKTIEKVRQFRADADYYLVVEFRDGHTQHQKGPTSIFFNPGLHQSIRVEHAINLNANEAMVVYRHDEASTKVAREIIYGPCIYTPEPSEWLEEFAWGKSPDPADPPPQKFTKVKCSPQQMYVDVQSVRTTDDAILVLNFMIVWCLKDAAAMLVETHDPIADFTNALCADVIAFSSKLTFEDLRGYTDKLNELVTYPHLTGRAAKCGFEISKIAFRGYETTEAVRRMQESGVEKRTQLQLERETAEQRESLADFKQHSEVRRAQERREMEQADKTHALELQRLELEARLKLEETLLEQRLRGQRQEAVAEAERIAAEHRVQVAFLQTLHAEMGLDVTKYLVAKAEAAAPRPEKKDDARK